MALPLLNVNADVVRQALNLALGGRQETAIRFLNLPVQKALAMADLDPELTPINVRFIDALPQENGSVQAGERYHWLNGKWRFADASGAPIDSEAAA